MSSRHRPCGTRVKAKAIKKQIDRRAITKPTSILSFLSARKAEMESKGIVPTPHWSDDK